MSKKKPLEAKIVKHAHRRRFQDYVRTKGREKMTLYYVYWHMYLRSGKGNVFELAEELLLSDLGINHESLFNARKTLSKDGWLDKESQPQSVTGVWKTTRWIVNETAIDSTAIGSADSGLTDSGSTDDGSADNTVVLHSLDAGASTSTQAPTEPSYSTPSASTHSSSFLVSQLADDSGLRPSSVAANQKEKAVVFETASAEEQRQPQEQTQEQKNEELHKRYETEWGNPAAFNARMDHVANNLHEPFGMPYITVDDVPAVLPIAHLSLVHGLNDSEVVGLAHWAKQHKFWKTRVPSYRSFGKAMENVTETGMVAQYKSHLNLRKGASAKAGSHAAINPELHRDGKSWTADATTWCGKCGSMHPKGQPCTAEERPKNPNCSRCKGPTYGNPTWEDDKPYCGDCMKMPKYRRESGQRDIYGKGDIDEPHQNQAKAAVAGKGFDPEEA